jgi:hypothetical protein
MSTNQVAGGTSANNAVYEEWSGAANSKWASFGVVDINKYGLEQSTQGHKYALKKWAICNLNFKSFGGESLNETRIKYSLTLGQHAANGYSDSTLAAQYWWLRSAGGEMDKYTQPLWFAQNSGDTRYQVSANERPPNWDEQSNHSKMIGLSPLITIG